MTSKLPGERLQVCSLCLDTGGKKWAAWKGMETARPLGEDQGLQRQASPTLPLPRWVILAK